MSKQQKYADHPRYGNVPRVTGLNPSPEAPSVFLHWNAIDGVELARRYRALTGEDWPHGEWTASSRGVMRIPNTAIAANLPRQTAATVAITHYFDIERRCVDCGCWFIFFAEEQKHWYEVLGFKLDCDCVRCVPCRKRQQGFSRMRERYEELFHVANRTADENLEMADCCLGLMEGSVFNRRQTERVRMLLKRVHSEGNPETATRSGELLARLHRIECQSEDKNV